MADLNDVALKIMARLGAAVSGSTVAKEELTLTIVKDKFLESALILRDEFGFEQLIDVCGVDYHTYGVAEWQTDSASATGFSRGVETGVEQDEAEFTSRFAAVYHLLSIQHNLRLRVRVYAGDDVPMVPSVIDVWRAADWFEREAFDLYGILFKGHPDLRRILTDYGFIGHPFRKDFPVSGHVEMRYDATQKRVVYEPVDITPRTLVPKVIRHDSRYKGEKVDG